MFTIYLIIGIGAILTISLSFAGLGDAAIWIHMLISSIQVCLLAYYWMHLQRSDSLTWLVALSALFIMILLFALPLTDLLTRNRRRCSSMQIADRRSQIARRPVYLAYRAFFGLCSLALCTLLAGCSGCGSNPDLSRYVYLIQQYCLLLRLIVLLFGDDRQKAGDSAQDSTTWRGVSGVLVEMADETDPIQIGETTRSTIRVTNQGSTTSLFRKLNLSPNSA